MIETTLRATSEKLKPGAYSTRGAPRSSSAQNSAKKRSIVARPSGVCRSPRAASRPSSSIASVRSASSRRERKRASRASQGSDRQRAVRALDAGAQPGQPRVAHEHQIALFGLVAGGGVIEAGWSVLDGIEPIGGQRLADRKPGARERLGRKALHRIA